MAKRRTVRHTPSGALGIANKRSAGAPALNPLTYSGPYLNVNVAARQRREEQLQQKLSKFAEMELTSVRPRRGPI